ncbi:immunoglobulin lambda-like polypeptide 5 [Sphaeramia orbicularis]|uniref:immunoglobulin lambda-like polypeptide 5 n=1 Tax=Sphaeramia orbicularis TaxID=375764 RepID=UPI00117D1DAE|nr:immunoglobulin lambda-like polypeptide 5 [Sphaeramia orbicularis]
MDLEPDPGSSSGHVQSTSAHGGGAHRFLYQQISLWYMIFGSGTKLYVTGDRPLKPVVDVYQAASTAHLDGKTSLLCVASGMFPPEVRFSWKRQKGNGAVEDLPDAEGEQLEVQESGRRTAIRTVHHNHHSSEKYWCTVQHEGGAVMAQTQQEVPALPPTPTVPPTPGPPGPPGPPVQPWDSQRLSCLFYSVLIMKSLLYCCGLCVRSLM